jgi:hypothetical protein
VLIVIIIAIVVVVYVMVTKPPAPAPPPAKRELGEAPVAERAVTEGIAVAKRWLDDGSWDEEKKKVAKYWTDTITKIGSDYRPGDAEM